ncbi:hypothetical protein SAMN05443572_10172 [Myxococcus fulvus]|uniref:Lipoprotein n=1 Tax=Myxococcus fulvus TaxID=33 RepID=A0A511T177_MYXFU|nr:hypothetical protein [Myxococcus fulvus]AKF84590.1 hypothetical protein MFUL124B02_01255 [Myxococcus fulvus 124B02]GEN07901.1 hypothetical protein MFU01_29380 [Myxococcus fulvus]SES75880.1 hypothetical protein SAMN05443572_10172 [Myxococcus fulvus]
MAPWMKALLIASLCLGPVLGFLAGRATQAPASTDLEPILRELAAQRALLVSLQTAQQGPSARAPSGDNLDTAWLRSEIAQAVREALEDSTPPEAAPKTPPPEPSPQALAALQEGHRVIDNAVAARRWTDEDARALRSTLSTMTASQQDEVLRRLVTTLNTNTLEVRTHGAPF